jgi:S-adenosylmethionine hydrolase
MAILEMELSEVDPKDPEYQKKRKIIDNYGNMLSTIRKKIDDVESRV